MKAGIVVYTREGRSLSGQWTHQDTGGALAREVVHDVPDAAVEGEWPVDIFRPDGQPYYSGRLTSVRFGGALRLSWVGSFVGSEGKVEFAGIGIIINENLIVGTFETAG